MYNVVRSTNDNIYYYFIAAQRSGTVPWYVPDGGRTEESSGNKLELVLYKLTNTPLKGGRFGTAVTAIIQSSSATTVMVVGFCKFRNDEGCAGNRYHHGSQHRNECDRLDFVSVVH